MPPSSSYLSPKQIVTRFVYPFFFDRNKAEEAACALARATTLNREGQRICIWERCEPPRLYREELLPQVDNFLFGQTARSCRYLTVNDSVASRWFNHVELTEPRAGVLPLMVRISLASNAGVEMFLTGYGVGALSIALQPHGLELSPQNATLFNYKLAQFRPAVAARLRVSHPINNAQVWMDLGPEERAKIPSPPPDHANIRDRMGVRGSNFLLSEMAHELLLHPLQQLGLKPFQEQFSIYTVIRYGAEVDLQDTGIRRLLSPFIAAVTQIEEPDHAGAIADDLNVRNEILNRRHWAAAGPLGVTHLVSDQPDDHPFNTQRVPRVMTKYFVPYVAAMIERVSLQLAMREAADLVVLETQRRDSDLSNLRKSLLEFAVEGYFPEVSHRQVLDRYYRMLQDGLGVRRAYDDVHHAITELDKANAAEHQLKTHQQMAQNIETTRILQEEAAKVQHKLGLLERFIVSVYAAELWHLIASDIQRLHRWVPYGVGVFALLGFFAAWALEKFWPYHPSNRVAIRRGSKRD